MIDPPNLPRASKLLHELKSTESQFLSVRNAVEHVAEGDRNKILYLVDYPEIKAFWQSKHPFDQKQLEDDGVRNVWDYLTGLEQFLTELQDDPQVKLRLLQRGYFEQAECLESLLLNDRFFTLVAPTAWRALEDDLIYLSSFQNDTAGNWQSAVSTNERDLIKEFGSQKHLTDDEFRSEPESFGFASLARDKKSSLAQIVTQFVKAANFQSAEDECWHDTVESATIAGAIAREISEFSGSSQHRDWSKLIEEGNDLYNQAFGRTGYWRRREEGAAVLAYLMHINTVLAKHQPELKVVFVTRNHQYHDMMQAFDLIKDSDLERPLIFHPRTLIAFMIRQSDERSFEDRTAVAVRIIKSIDELLGTFRLVRQFVADVAGRGDSVLSTPLRNFVVKRLGEGLRDFRGLALAEKVQPRIADRKVKWAKGPNRKVTDILEKVSVIKLQASQWRMELSLLKAQPPVADLAENVGLIYVDLQERENGTAVLITASTFSHPFKFFSGVIERQLKKPVLSDRKSIVDLVESARIIAEVSFERQGLGQVRARGESENKEKELQLAQLRFDLLMMMAILLADKARYKEALDAIGLAQKIFERTKLPRFPSEDSSYALNEALYLEGIVRRLVWRRDPSIEDNTRKLDSGVEALKLHIEKINSLLGPNGYRGKRLRVFLAAFQRELLSFAAKKKVGEDQRWPISTAAALQMLGTVLTESTNSPQSEFHYVSLRASQHLLAYQRMLEDREIEERVDPNQFSRVRQLEVFKKFMASLDHMRSDLDRIDGSRHYSTFVTELSGLVRFNTELKSTREDIEAALRHLESLKEPQGKPGLIKQAKRALEEARKFLQPK